MLVQLSVKSDKCKYMCIILYVNFIFCITELNSVRQKTSNLEKDYIKAQKVVFTLIFQQVIVM